MTALSLSMMNDDDERAPHPAARGNDRAGDRQLRSLLRTLVAAFAGVVMTVIGAGIGWWLDRAAGTAPRWTIAICLACFALGIYGVVREVRR
jgi:F0F1-type ATP synthase assembly protein I